MGTNSQQGVAFAFDEPPIAVIAVGRFSRDGVEFN